MIIGGLARRVRRRPTSVTVSPLRIAAAKVTRLLPRGLDEIGDLHSFKEKLRHQTPEISKAEVTPKFWDRLRHFGPQPAGWSPARFAAAAAAGLILLASATALLFYVWRSIRSPRTESAMTQPTDAAQPTTENTAVPEPSAIPSPSPVVVVSLDDGGQRVTLDEQGNLAGLGPLSPATQRALKAALTDGRVRTPAALNALAGRSGVLLGGSSEGVAFPLVGPVGTVVRTDRPTLRWRPLAGAQGYTVTLLDADLNPIAISPPLTATGWTVARPLERGQTYVWQVAAQTKGGEVIAPAAPAPEARFKILELAKAAQLRRLEAAHPSSHLARGVSYAQAGLLDDAAREFRALLAANPQSPVARKLLRNVEARRHQK